MEVKARTRQSSVEGILHLPLALALLTLTGTALGISVLGQIWTRKVHIQLEIDRCVGTRALVLRNTLNSIDASNARIRALRVVSGGALALGQIEVTEASRAAIQVVARLQDLEMVRWQAEQVRWWTDHDCAGMKAPLPSLALQRRLADTLGENELVWSSEKPKTFQLQLGRAGRRARASIFEEKSPHGNWQASWRYRTPAIPTKR